jgi:membrane protein
MIAGLKLKLDELVWGVGLYKHGLPGRILASVLRNLYAVLRDIISGQLTLRSMSLVYTTLLSVVPLVAVVLAWLFSSIRPSRWCKRSKKALTTSGM